MVILRANLWNTRVFARMRMADGLPQRGVEFGAVEHDLVVGYFLHRREWNSEIAGVLDIDSDLVVRDVADGANLLVAVMHEDGIIFPDRIHHNSLSDITWDGAVVRRLAVGKIEHHFIDIAPAPTFGRIIALDDRMLRRVKMLGRMPVRRVVA